MSITAFIGSDVVDNSELVQKTQYPPFNIRKTGDNTYALDLDMTGYSKDSIVSKVDGQKLIIEAKSNKKISTNSEDQFFHNGISLGKDIDVFFKLAPGISCEGANLTDGILTFTFKYVKPVEVSNPVVVPIGPIEPEVPKTISYIPLYGSNGDIVGKVDAKTGEQTAVDPKASLPLLPPATAVSIAFKPDVSQSINVSLLDPMPQIVELSYDEKSGLKVQNATNEIKEDDVNQHLVQKDGRDIIVAVPKSIPASSEPVQAVQVALDKVNVSLPIPDAPKTSEASEIFLPKPLTIVVPNVISQIVELHKDSTGKLFLTSEKSVPSTYSIYPAVTAPGQPDVVVIVSPETNAAIDHTKVDIAKDVSDALKTANPTIVKAQNPIVSA